MADTRALSSVSVDISQTGRRSDIEADTTLTSDYEGGIYPSLIRDSLILSILNYLGIGLD